MLSLEYSRISLSKHYNNVSHIVDWKPESLCPHTIAQYSAKTNWICSMEISEQLKVCARGQTVNWDCVYMKNEFMVKCLTTEVLPL